MNLDRRYTIIILCVVLLPFVDHMYYADQAIRRRGFEFQLCGGLPFKCYSQGELKSVFDQAESLDYVDALPVPDVLIEVGWAIAKDLYMAFTIDYFSLTYVKPWSPFPLFTTDGFSLHTTLYGASTNYYPFHSGLLIKGFVGAAIVEQSESNIADATSTSGVGTAIVVAYDSNPRIAALTFLVGLKGCLVLLPNSKISAVGPIFGISYR